jgi:hypothetical protein
MNKNTHLAFPNCIYWIPWYFVLPVVCGVMITWDAAMRYQVRQKHDTQYTHFLKYYKKDIMNFLNEIDYLNFQSVTVNNILRERYKENHSAKLIWHC